MVVFRHDLAELLLKLRQFDKAEKVLKQALEQDAGGKNCTVLEEVVLSSWLLMEKFIVKCSSKIYSMELMQNMLLKAKNITWDL